MRSVCFRWLCTSNSDFNRLANIGAISQAFSKHRHEVSLNTFSHTGNNAWNNARNACHACNVILTPIDRMKIIIDVYRRGADANLVNEK